MLYVCICVFVCICVYACELYVCFFLTRILNVCLFFLFFLSPFRVLREHVMVRIGGGWDTLESYLDKTDPCRAHGKEQVK